MLEGASYTLSVHPDAKLEAYLDRLIAKIGAAQEPDGYLYTTRTINPASPHAWAGPERWVLEKVDSHELYNLGHLYEAAVAHHQATGKRSLLDIALKTADLLTQTFGPGKRRSGQATRLRRWDWSSLPGNRRAAVSTSPSLCSTRAGRTATEARAAGTTSLIRKWWSRPSLSATPCAPPTCIPASPIAALTGDAAYVNAIDRIWESMVGRKLYITGGIGASASGEAFGRDYELPNLSAYNETCAAIGNDYWNHRLFLLHADAKYIDVMERTLYNGLISGVSLDGKSFFYPNPLESNGRHQRSPWFGVACCPGNITRFMASVPGYVYAQQGDALRQPLRRQRVRDRVGQRPQSETDAGDALPLGRRCQNDGDPDKADAFAINVRIPGWARNEAAPGDLYRFLDQVEEPVMLKVNGKPVSLNVEKGYVSIRRKWKRAT